ncbi:MAG: hypothetical protein FIB04_08745 [Gammaproteobacteria bacterium]|nr:hypothetical protein [Gammaproteobacteria bacterium]
MTAPEECVPAGRGLLWYRTSAERRAVVAQTFQFAGDRIAQLAAGHRPGTWAVVMDADETILDNSDFLLAIARGEQSDAREAWVGWAREKRAGLQPGAEAFVNRVRQLGGMVIVVTNRDDVACPATQQNLADLGIVVRGVLCATNGVYNKNLRFDSIRDGTSSLGLGPIDVLMFVGDNIRDFPGRSQSAPEPLSSFGETYVILPNPMYGSWDKNALH